VIPAEIEQLWARYLTAEHVRIRQRSLRALEEFVEALLSLPTAEWHLWARQLSHRVVDCGENIPIRLPLFQKVLFPALLAGLETSVAGAARWLSGFTALLYNSPSCRDCLPQELRTEHGLLFRALGDDPEDTRAKKRLRQYMRSSFESALHELPAGILYGQNGASIEECAELLNDLAMYERLSTEVGSPEDRELIVKARYVIPAYQRYLSERCRYSDFETFLDSNPGS